MNYEFKLTDTETRDADNFRKEHKDCCLKELHKPFFSSTDGQFTFSITPTGLGNCVIIRCNACGKEEDITDVSSW